MVASLQRLKISETMSLTLPKNLVEDAAGAFLTLTFRLVQSEQDRVKPDNCLWLLQGTGSRGQHLPRKAVRRSLQCG